MNHHSSEGPDDEDPVLRIPRGAVLRALTADQFDSYAVQSKAALYPLVDMAEKVVEHLP